jgi:adenine-specific DNA methylase
MALKIFNALFPYFGNKRKLGPVIFHYIAKFLPREMWQGAVFVDAFLGSGSMGLLAKAYGFRVTANDVALRSVIAGRALIENNHVRLGEVDLHRLFVPNPANLHIIEQEFVPDVFMKLHAQFLDNAFANAKRDIDKYLLVKHILSLRPYSKFSSPNAFNRPMAEGRFDEIKSTYTKHIKDNLKSPLEILKRQMPLVNAGVFSNGLQNKIYQGDVLDFIEQVDGDVLYLDPPYSGTLAYENEYAVLDRILGDAKVKSRFSADNGMDALDEIFARSERFPLWVISFGNAGGKNELNKLVEMVRKYRQCEAQEFAYRHCEAMASDKHKQQSREFLVLAWK